MNHESPQLLRESKIVGPPTRKIPWDLIVNGALAVAAAGVIASFLIRPIVKEEVKPLDERVSKVETKVEVLEAENKDIVRRLDEIRGDTLFLIKLHMPPPNGYDTDNPSGNGKPKR